MISLITSCIIVSQNDLLFGGFYSFIWGGGEDLIGIVEYRHKGYVMGNIQICLCQAVEVGFYILKIHGEK